VPAHVLIDTPASLIAYARYEENDEQGGSESRRRSNPPRATYRTPRRGQEMLPPFWEIDVIESRRVAELAPLP